ncbi:L-aspartate oxidase [Prochlorococcus sp. MIT 1300]|uniref:L-aspartate oxidase n=1 Tax=Prochlorococcus sp. MIT 1300 TaxID=3096218 RepID=UPI002A74A266|nr:L-aspartate oxidase [Prochlorococcus sp. MIT 1300]
MRRSPLSSSIDPGPWDVVVVGAGAAGLMTCLELPKNLNVLLLNRNTSRRSSSRWAQGGIAAVTRSEDSVQSHAEDTFKAGAGLCDGDAVRLLVEEAPKCVSRLQKLGMEFDRVGNELATTLEAAHSHRRVLHVQDRTGRALVEVLEDQVEHRSNIFHRRGVRVTQLWVQGNVCCGAQVLDGPHLHWISARAVVLATGGGGHLFANTTNPAQACGEGVALAWRAGAAVEDMEFVQFHPTALRLKDKDAPCFLISEALRGEGAVLIDSYGQSPVAELKGGDLAPRDQISRALVKAMQLQGVQHIGLDLSPMSKTFAEARFPTILEHCRELGLDPLNSLIPVAPAAHYWMGGVATDLQAATTLKGLFAVGEVACTGLHGANRLASNSLMECLVFARQLASVELNSVSRLEIKRTEFVSDSSGCLLKAEENVRSLLRQIEDLRKLCWFQAGVDRSAKGMHAALLTIQKDLAQTKEEDLLKMITEQPKDLSIRLENGARRELNLLLDLSHRQLTSYLMLRACLFRDESRGGHFRNDAPATLPYWRCHSRQTIFAGLFTRPVHE